MDSFGTEPAFNLGSYARSHGYKTLWGSWGLKPLQYMTMFRKFSFSVFTLLVADYVFLTVHTNNNLQKHLNIVLCTALALLTCKLRQRNQFFTVTGDFRLLFHLLFQRDYVESWSSLIVFLLPLKLQNGCVDIKMSSKPAANDETNP